MDKRKEILRKMTVCRFCFVGDVKQLSSIYQKEPKSVPLPIQIMSCVSIEVFPNDGLPELICNKCRQQTNQSYIFKSNCKKANDALQQFLRNGDVIKPQIQTLSNQQTKKRPITPVKDVEVVSRAAANDGADIKRQKLDDGTEIITLCISQSDDPVNQDETSQDSEPGTEEPPAQDNNDRLPRHINKPEQVETGIHPCPHCEKTFSLEQLLELHAANHHRERNFKCPQCDSSFFSKYDMTKHQQIHEDDKSFACKICSKEFARESLLRVHEKTHSDAPMYMCTGCEQTFVDKDLLEIHMKKHEKNRPYICRICQKSFVFKQGLERHMGSVHSEERSFKCNYCDATFSSLIRLTRHITTHAGSRPYPCKVCGRTFLLSHHLTRHMRSHYGTQSGEVLGQHKCDICSMSFRRKDSLINHSVIHSMVNLRCVICNTSFEDASLVKDHITTHLQGLPFPCERCEYSFDTQKQLLEHEVKHAEMEYEEQIEQEIVCGAKPGDDEFDDASMEPQDYDDYEENDESDIAESMSTYHISNIDEHQLPTLTKMPDIDVNLKQFFKSEADTAADTDEETDDPAEVPAIEDSGIKPIKRLEGTKMYERKGPIQRKVPEVQQTQPVETVPIEEINEPPNIDAEVISKLPKKPENVKMGDKVVKVHKFIISKEEMKNMAKLGILELKDGQVLMKSPGRPALNAKIKPVQQSDIDTLISRRRTKKKEYGRKRNSVPDDTGE